MKPTTSDRFEDMFRENYAAVRAYALRRAPGDIVQDVVAETFLVAWRRVRRLSPTTCSPGSTGLRRLVLANQLRSMRRSAALEHRLSASAVAGSHDTGEGIDDALSPFAPALALLSPRDREALTLVAWHGLSGARAARAAGCSRGAFAVRLHRARARLATELSSLHTPVAAVDPDSLEVG